MVLPLKVLLTLKKPGLDDQSAFLAFHVTQLGLDTKVRKFDLCAAAYIRELDLSCPEFKGWITNMTCHLACSLTPAS